MSGPPSSASSGPRQPRPAIRAVHVVVPARDEERHVGACLASVRYAADALARAHPDVGVGVLLVLDRCADTTAAIAAGLEIETLAVSAGCVGGARRAGVQRIAEGLGELHPAEVLVLNTDADCVVPATWLVEHLGLAAAHDLVQGKVSPHPGDLSPGALAAWRERNPAGSGSLHGANLGFRLDAYLRAGGFPAIAAHEDLLLVRAMKAGGAAATGGTTVVTSGRREGRVAGGFASYLTRLDAELEGAGPRIPPPR